MNRSFRSLLLLACCVGLLIVVVSVSMAQTAPPPSIFTAVTQIGRTRPAGIQYDPNFDRVVYVSRDGALTLADARTFSPTGVLYESGVYSAYAFSPDGRWLALAIDRRVEIWNTTTATVSATLEPPGANFTQGPLTWSDDGTLLLLETNVPAPQALRRSETDTVVLPWLWDVAAARDERRSVLPGQVDAQPYFNVTVTAGMSLAGTQTLVQGLPGRLLVSTYSEPSTGFEVEANRIEREPIYLWRSLSAPFIYIDQRSGAFTQLDTRTNTAFPLPLGRDLRGSRMDVVAQSFALPPTARRVGAVGGADDSTLASQALGLSFSAEHSTLYVLDVIRPYTPPDDPQRRPVRALLIFIVDEDSGLGVMDLIRPQNLTQFALSPDGERLAVRRASASDGIQPIDLYNVPDGVWERTLLAPEPDLGGDYLFEFTADGRELLVDFQRYNASTGDLLTYDPTYTAGFNAVVFSDTPGQIITFGGSDPEAITTWDIATGLPVERDQRLRLGGGLYQTETGMQRVLIEETNRGAEVTIANEAANSTASFTIPARIPGGDPNAALVTNEIVVSPLWTRFLAVYMPPSSSQHADVGREYVVYEPRFDPDHPAFGTAVALLHFAGDDALPYAQAYFADEDTLVLYQDGSAQVPGNVRAYGLDFHPSGLPQCIVDAFPAAWPEWVPVWRRIQLTHPYPQLMERARMVCETVATRTTPQEVSAALTTTPAPAYASGATPVPINVPGVPRCLTTSFRQEAYDYAELWRAITAGLDEDAAEELAQMVCEGLVQNPFNIQPTATLDPNSLVAATPTPLPAGPETVSGTGYVRTVLTIDIPTGTRALGDHLLPAASRLDGPTWSAEQIEYLVTLYRQQFNQSPNSPPVLDRTGTLAAELNAAGHVVIYRLSRPFAELWDEGTRALSAGSAIVSVGLAPTATRTFAPAPDIRPTLTPTITWTPYPPPQTQADGPGFAAPVDICPLRQLHWLADGAALDAPGRLWVDPIPQIRSTFPLANAPWMMDAASGRLYADPSQPDCSQGNCRLSPGGEWMLYQSQTIQVMRPDGTAPVVLFEPEEVNYFPYDMQWIDGDTLEWQSERFIPGAYDPVQFTLRYDAATNTLSEPFLPWSASFDSREAAGELPVTVFAMQPVAEQWLLLGINLGSYQEVTYELMMYNIETGEGSLFARAASIDFMWRPDGGLLFYILPDGLTYTFDPAANTHRVLGRNQPFNAGIFSPDGRLQARWIDPSRDAVDITRTLLSGALPPKLVVWDTVSNTVQRFCLPETGTITYGDNLIWSPDSRYLAFIIGLPLDGDFVPTPTTTPTRNPPTATPVPLDAQYDNQFRYLLILDTHTGMATVVSRDISSIQAWVPTHFAEGLP